MKNQCVRQLCLGVICLCFCCAEKHTSTPYRVQWPAEWEVTHLPSPDTSSGKNLGGGRERAIYTENGVIVAIIELTYIPRTDKGKLNLADEFNVALRTIQKGYEQKQLKIVFRMQQLSQICNFPSKITEISASGTDIHLKQWMGMALSPSYIYSLTFTASEENFSRFRSEFDEIVKIIQLQ